MERVNRSGLGRRLGAKQQQKYRHGKKKKTCTHKHQSCRDAFSCAFFLPPKAKGVKQGNGCFGGGAFRFIRSFMRWIAVFSWVGSREGRGMKESWVGVTFFASIAAHSGIIFVSFCQFFLVSSVSTAPCREWERIGEGGGHILEQFEWAVKLWLTMWKRNTPRL